MKRLLAVSLLVAAMFAAIATSAVAQNATPPGNGAVGEYSESTPGAGGDESTRGGGSGDNGSKGSKNSGGNAGSGSSVVPQGTQRQLASGAADGDNVVQVANETAPGSKGSDKAKNDDGNAGGVQGAEASSKPSGKSIPTQAAETAGGSGGGGLGVTLPILLAVALAAATVILMTRKRRDDDTTAL